MKELIIINPFCPEADKTERLDAIVEYSTKGCKIRTLATAEEVEAADLRNKRILFTISLGQSGINLSLYGIIKYFRLNRDALTGAAGGVILDGNCEFYTKSTGRSVVFTANRAGCTFPGRPLVEGTRTLKNYNIQAQNLRTDNMGAYMAAGKELVNNILCYEPVKKEHPKLLALHASNGRTSNTLALWDMVRKHLPECSIREISLRNGSVVDCRGCSYEACRHYGEEGGCFYGGPITEQVYPAILDCDALVMICPNYNDAMGANLTAFVNRMTALFTTHRFYEKSLFGIIVSGYSGGDIVAEQLISGLNMNKTFALPGKFAILETANDPKAILSSEDAAQRGRTFAENIRKHLIKERSTY